MAYRNSERSFLNKTNDGEIRDRSRSYRSTAVSDLLVSKSSQQNESNLKDNDKPLKRQESSHNDDWSDDDTNADKNDNLSLVCDAGSTQSEFISTTNPKNLESKRENFNGSVPPLTRKNFDSSIVEEKYNGNARELLKDKYHNDHNNNETISKNVSIF